jgi:hypothetical protein
MTSRPILALLATSLLLFGCHKPTPAPAPTPHVAPQSVTDSCLVLTPGEITTALAIPVGDGKHALADSEDICKWPRSGGRGKPVLVLSFSSADAFDRQRNAKGTAKILAAPGIGDDAFYVTSELGTSLFIRKGNTFIGFSIHDEKLLAAQIMPAEKTLGLKAVTRL